MSSCTQQTLANPYVHFAIQHVAWLIIAVMGVWIIKRGVR